jgi:hypothetical protein
VGSQVERHIEKRTLAHTPHKAVITNCSGSNQLRTLLIQIQLRWRDLDCFPFLALSVGHRVDSRPLHSQLKPVLPQALWPSLLEFCPKAHHSSMKFFHSRVAELYGSPVLWNRHQEPEATAKL